VEKGHHWYKHPLWPCRFRRVSDARLVSGMRDRISDSRGTCELNSPPRLDPAPLRSWRVTG